MNGKRDCKNCIHKVPVFDEEEGIWRGADCDAWECNFVSREEALKAYEGRAQGECGNRNFNDRAISSNALKEALIIYCDHCEKNGPYRCEHCLTNVFEDMIDNAPTITVEEWVEAMPLEDIDLLKKALTPKGEWIYTDFTETKIGHFICSKCGWNVAMKTNKFCPNCGAKMGGST